MTGNVRSGVIVTGSSGGSTESRVMHISRGMPLTSAEHEPHFPALQFHLTARSLAWLACARWTASSTTWPSSAGTT